MEITKELKEKLLKAESAEEVKALLGDEVTEAEAAAVWREIEAHKAHPDLKKVNSDWCWFTDLCAGPYITYSNYDPCPKGGNHDWMYTTETVIGKKRPIMKCKKCGETNYQELAEDLLSSLL